MVATTRRSRKKSSSLAPPARRGNLGLLVVIAGLVLVNLYVFLWRDGTSLGAIKDKANSPEPAAINGPGLTGGSGSDGVSPAGSGSGALDEGPAEAAPVAITGTVGKTDSLGKILKREGLT